MEFEEDDWDSITAANADKKEKDLSPLKTPVKLDRLSIKPPEKEPLSARTDERIAKEKALSMSYNSSKSLYIR